MPLTSFVAVDTETTGLDFERDRVIEIAAVRFEDGQPVAQFEALLSPGDRALSPVSRLITGLDPAELRAAPPAAESLLAFLEFVGASPLVAHNAAFDAHFVRRAAEAEGLAPPPGYWLDSLLMSRVAWPEWESHKLDALADRLGFVRDGEHRALPDARRAGLVFLAAQRATRREVSSGTRRDLARLAADLPDWSLVFTEEDNDSTNGNAADTHFEAVVAAPSTPSVDSEARTTESIGAAIQSAIDSAIATDGVLAIETPAGSDEHEEGLRAALTAAQSGKRVLLAVADASALNVLQRSALAQNVAVRVATLGTPAEYASRARLAALAENPARVPPEERAALLPLIAWTDRYPGVPVWAARGFSPERARLAWSRVRCDAWSDDPAAQSARAVAEAADVVCVTHATLCAHAALDGALLPSCDMLLVTGAHRLPEAAAERAGRRATLFRLRDILQLVCLSSTREEGAWTDLADAIPTEERGAWRECWFAPDRELQTFLQKAGRRAEKLRAPGDFRVRYTEHAALAFGIDPAPALEALRANEAMLETLAGGSNATAQTEARRILTRLRAFRADFEFLCTARDPECLYWFEDVANPHKAALRVLPCDMGGLGAALGDLFAARVLLSPALFSGKSDTDAGDAGTFLHSAGLLTRDETLTVTRVPGEVVSPRFVIAPFAPATGGGAGGGEQTGVFARFLAEAAEPWGGAGVLVFCPSQTSLRSLHGALRATLPPGIPLWAQHLDGNRDALARLYASGRGGWVLSTEATPGLRDADGNAPALWVVTRMPLPTPRDPLLEARAELLRAEGGEPRREPWHAAAILRIKREWHALLRSGQAPATIWLTDARAADGMGTRLAGAMGWEAHLAKDVEALKETVPPQSGNWEMGNGKSSP